MSKKCCIPNCRLQKDDPGCLKLNFFQVPSNEDNRQKWFDNIKNYFKKEVALKKFTYVCGLHFESECFNYSEMCNLVRLKKGSCPTVFENYSLEEYLENKVQNSSRVLMDVTNSSVPTSSTSNYSENIVKDIYENNFMERLSVDNDGTYELNQSQNLINGTEIVEANEANKDYVNNDSCTQSNNEEKNVLSKSLANIDLNNLNYNDKSTIKKILKKAQEEIIALRRNRRRQSMQLYRARKLVKNSKSLIAHVKQGKFISERVLHK